MRWFLLTISKNTLIYISDRQRQHSPLNAITGKFSLSPTNMTFPFLKQGTVGFENQINKCLELAEYLYAKIKNREEFEMVFDGEVSYHPGLDI